MNQFYVSIVFLGIILIGFSLVWIAYDRKKSDDYSSQIKEKKEELEGIITDAEQMIGELNRFSDYVVTQMELKNEELCANLKNVEDKIKNVSIKVYDKNEVKAIQGDKVVNGNVIDIRVNNEIAENIAGSSNLVLERLEAMGGSRESAPIIRPQVKSRDNVIPLNSKCREVLQLAQSGMSETEIAKKLNIGKGEIQFILGVNK